MDNSVRRALISVSDKEGVVEFSRSLGKFGIQILSTGGTAKLLMENNILVTEVSDHTGFPEIMGGRVKTLHPKIHGGILGRRGIDEKIMDETGIDAIDLVVVNLYPFQQTIAKAGCTLANAVENIDIGGPAMLRAAAKNYTDVAVIVDESDYSVVLLELANNDGKISDETRFTLAVNAYRHTAEYDNAVATYLGGIDQPHDESTFPNTYYTSYEKKQDMRYGENPHQRGAFYVNNAQSGANVSTAKQLQGKALSYNNIADTDAALECVKQFNDQPTCVIVKHANPCGVALAEDLLQAYERAYSTDTESAFGGIIAFNRELDEVTAKKIVERQFVEVLVAPKISSGALDMTKEKGNIRVLETGYWEDGDSQVVINTLDIDFKKVCGGILIQDTDVQLYDSLEVVTNRKPDESEMHDLLFAWQVAKYVKSNAIVYALNKMTVGIGAGQMSRINSARIAAIKAEHAGLMVSGAVMASDAFFPFRDGLDNAGAAGIRAVIQPGGSIKDEDIITAANEQDIAMVFTGMRHFRH